MASWPFEKAEGEGGLQKVGSGSPSPKHKSQGVWKGHARMEGIKSGMSCP